MKLRRLTVLVAAAATCLTLLPTAAMAAPACEVIHVPLTERIAVECTGMETRTDYTSEIIGTDGNVIASETQGTGDDGTFHIGISDVGPLTGVREIRVTGENGTSFTLPAEEGSAAVTDGASTTGGSAGESGQLPYTGPA